MTTLGPMSPKHITALIRDQASAKLSDEMNLKAVSEYIDTWHIMTYATWGKRAVMVVVVVVVVLVVVVVVVVLFRVGVFPRFRQTRHAC